MAEIAFLAFDEPRRGLAARLQNPACGTGPPFSFDVVGTGDAIGTGTGLAGTTAAIRCA